jgi:hypothetical protein
MIDVFLACPMRSRLIDWGAARSVWRTAAQRHSVDVCPGLMTVLPSNCNRLLCTALNTKEAKGYEWFAMLHDDIEPPPFWLDTLIAEADKHGADLMSAVVPLKDGSGTVSTAIARPDSKYGVFRRLTLHQVLHPTFPSTFGIGEAVDALARLPEPLRVEAPRTVLLANTGCMVYRLSHWKPGIIFAQEDDVQLVDGQWWPVFQSEDWAFTRRVTEHGGKVMATRVMNIVHHGTTEYQSSQPHGHGRDIASETQPH